MKWFLMLALFSVFSNAAYAEVFQGEVVSVDRNQGTITVQNRAPNGLVIEQRIFALRPRILDNAVYDSIDVGEEINVDAVNQNGIWQVQTLLTNPLSPNTGVLVANPNGSVQSNAVLATTGNTTRAVTFPPSNLVQQSAPVVVGLESTTPSGTNVAGVVTASPTGVNTFNSTFEGTTVSPTGVTSTGGTGSTSSGVAGTTTVSGASGVPTRSGAEGVPARSGAQGTSQTL